MQTRMFYEKKKKKENYIKQKEIFNISGTHNEKKRLRKVNTLPDGQRETANDLRNRVLLIDFTIGKWGYSYKINNA